ncbi:MAG: Soluble lytic murein transglycosylase [Alphaproteobacteria bacterium MarineAlpha3_Bin5]|nr:lytic murein transglycosylase [Magnetovibrio sp.]PPR74871.1 MAG: Soluble lytic murein transglycosylase [Alphaproteobacteria bacterium MarineAlpha3_Bin5]
MSIRKKIRKIFLFSFVLLAVFFCINYSVVAVETEITKKEVEYFREIIKKIRHQKIKDLKHSSITFKDPLIRKIIVWFLLDSGGLGMNFNEINKFIKVNPGWPNIRKWRVLAEESLPNKMSPGEIIEWFEEIGPISSMGRVKLASAHLSISNKRKGKTLIRNAWIKGNFTKRQEKEFYRKYNKLLTREDNRNRLDRLLWEGRYWPTRRMLWKVDKDYQSLAEARFALRHSRGNVDKLIALVPNILKKDPGLLYERLRWRRRRNLESAFTLLEKIPENLIYVNRWWKERSYLARKLLRKGHITAAYKAASKHNLKKESGADYAEAEWFSGWVALRFLGDHKIALSHFQRMYDAVSYPISKSRGAYWLGRTADSSGEKGLARKWYEIGSKNSTTYYGQLSFTELHLNSSLRFPLAPKIEPGLENKFNRHELVRAIKLLARAKIKIKIKPFLKSILSVSDDSGWMRLTAELCLSLGYKDLSIWISKKSLRKGISLIKSNYPEINLPTLKDQPSDFTLENALVLALIRQESMFNLGAISPAKARGLMQLMPNTAKRTVKRLGLKYSKSRLLTDPNYNIKIGKTFLLTLMQQFKGSHILSLAAYNAGNSRVKRWIHENGDPRDPLVDSIDWVELIPIKETRNYIQRVLENLQVYRHILSGTEAPVSLRSDLHLKASDNTLN